jgi:hypothetical protein
VDFEEFRAWMAGPTAERWLGAAAANAAASTSRDIAELPRIMAEKDGARHSQRVCGAGVS